ncbi:MAG TPA: ROK family protein [Solirubrobacteraceae bacterium]|nr:ROK family protein [Solirubrobacteraceae bacterium]
MSIRAGVDLGGTKIQTIIVDDDFEVLASARRPTPTVGGPEAVAKEIIESVREAAGTAAVDLSALEGIGVGSPGEIDEATGTVSEARNIPGWEGSYPLSSVLGKALGSPVRLGNDVTVATTAEFTRGAARQYDSLLGVFWGTGVGGGLILDGKPWFGRGGAGEIGHMVVELDGAQCLCGRRGCMEAYAGRAAMEIRARELADKGHETELFELMAKRGRTRLTSGIWARALKRSDPLAEKLVGRAIAALGAGVASAVNLLDVEAVVIGGGLGDRLGQPYADRIAAAMQPHLFADARPPAIVVSSLGDLGGALGAAMLVG